ncbi:hypothetical protein JCM21714_3739 [Gracilibacillus boraciitolerans JCM 21714]|uniref:Uncharacterized protein n=1 Tax=Gracilibacillus boraciitolerans JCM 21714 TaxID=1298598 RepID=W4VP95_9BACI|nr:hypothetical protein [Gracilibacillus boraciitolerans]GAE94569.1 hypothetical protein JCM21714_3739 [Gracilibacillus boraciitolerans JCM 21714]
MNLIHRLITVMFICMSVPLLVSSNTLQAKQTDSIHVLVVFSSNEDQIDEYQRLLELQLAHFSENITFRHSSHVTKSDLSKTTHLVYQGTIDEEIPSNTVKLINSFTGPLLAIGHNIEQLSSYWKIDRDTIYLEEATILMWMTNS